MPQRKVASNSLYFPPYLRAGLNKILEYPLTLIEAGSGFGKTTAVAQFLRRNRDSETYWYTCLGEPPKKAWANVCALFGKVDPQTAEYLRKLIAPTLDTFGEISMLLDDIACSKETVLVIDNFQLIHFEDPIKLLHAFSFHSCPRLHIVVLTQPLLAAGSDETVSSPYIYYLSQDFFCFNRSSVEAYFKKANIILTPGQTDLVYNTTEGWVAALRLLLQHLRQAGSFENVSGFTKLMDTAFWNQLNMEQRDLFLSLSVYESFTPALAAATQFGSVLSIEERLLLQKSPFVHWAEASNTYYFHSLLKTYLQEKLAEMPKRFQFEIWERSGKACAECGQLTDAARFFEKSGNFQAWLTLPYTDEQLEDLIRYGDRERMEKWFQECPKEKLFLHPEQILRLTFECFLQGDFQRFGLLFSLLNEMCREPNLYEEKRAACLAGNLEFIRSFLAFNDISAMTACHQKAYALLNYSPLKLFHFDATRTFGAPSVVQLFWREPGNLWQSLKQVDACLPCYYQLTGNHGFGASLAMEAEVLLLAGDDVAAETLSYKALYQANSYRQDSICFCSELILARIAILRGDYSAYQTVLDSIHHRAFEGSDMMGVATAELCRAYLDLVLGRSENMPIWLSDVKAMRGKVYDLATPFCKMIYVYLIREHRRRFRGEIEAFITEAEELHMVLPKLYYLIYLAVAQEQEGCRGEAEAFLEQALALGLADKAYLPFAEFYPELEGVFKVLAPKNREKREDLDKIFALGRRMRLGKQKINSVLEPEAHTLTPREREIALLAQERLTVKEIAARLFISESTVKNTMQKVYEKLDVHSKIELKNKVL